MKKGIKVAPFTHKNRSARIYSLQFLFHLQFEEFAHHKKALMNKSTQEEAFEEALSNYHSTFKEEHLPPTSALIFAHQLIKGTLGHYQDLESMISTYLNKGTLKHIPKIDLTILLQSLYEILHFPATPKNVVINEAVELAKKFSTKEAAAFINGILDKVVKTQ